MTDNNGQNIDVGSVVNVPCTITAVALNSLSGVALLTLAPKYTKPDGTAATAIATVYANQVTVNRGS